MECNVTNTQLDLLDEPLISVRSWSDEIQAIDLPELLSRLGEDSVASFPKLRPHQEHAWHAFLTQLAAIALHRVGRSTDEMDPESWKEALLRTAGDQREAWCLVVEDESRPAFMQPPTDVASLKNRHETPEALDLLVLTKNHDVKAARMHRASPEHWLLALVTLQTMQGFSGRSKYGIARMNGGFGNRPSVTLRPGWSPGRRWRRDTRRLLASRQSLADGHGYRSAGGNGLLWLEPWSGDESLPLTACDPFVIEVCRRVRLMDEDGRLVVLESGSRTARLEAPEGGDTGDPWAPVKLADRKVLTLPEAGFHAARTQELLFGTGWEQPPTLRLGDDEPDDLLFHAQALSRGQGQTKGFHERAVPIPGRVRSLLAAPEEHQRLATRASRWIDLAANARRKVLKPAVLVLLQGGPEELNWRDDGAESWLAAFDRRVDQAFFAELWRSAVEPDGEADAAWCRLLLQAASEQLEDAKVRAPIPSVRVWRARSFADRAFHGAARKVLRPAFHEDQEELA